jgi:hypothetical protein
VKGLVVEVKKIQKELEGKDGSEASPGCFGSRGEYVNKNRKHSRSKKEKISDL